MSKITFEGMDVDCLDSESVLDALLRIEANVPFSCKTGVCQTCLMRASKGTIPPAAQKGLKDTLMAQNYFLACACKPDHDIEISLPDVADVYGRAVIRDKKFLAEDVCQLLLKPANELYYHAGQFINLRRSDGLVRSYSIASLPQTDSYIELHVKRMKNGRMSNWLFDQAEAGQELDIQGPVGHCFYTSGAGQQNMLLVGTGTGLAPLYGISRDALHSGHGGEIYLYHGCRREDGFYLHEQLLTLESEFENFKYIPCITGSELAFKNNQGVTQGRANEIALQRHINLDNWRVYLCGIPGMVNAAKKMAYLAGASMSDIYADPFELTDLRKIVR